MFYRNLIAILFIFTTFHIYAADYNKVDFSIRYFDKKIYYPGDSVQIKASIINNSPDKFSFNLSENKIFNVKLNVKTMSNQSLNPSENYIINSSRNSNTFYREITLDPGEEFSFIVDLDDYTDIGSPGMYIIDGMFTTDLNNPDNFLLISNRLPLSIRPGSSEREFTEYLDYRTGEILRAEPIPPDEAVRYMLEARQQSVWPRFFLYIDLLELMLNDSNKKRQYERSTEEEQQVMLRNFREDMEGERLRSDQSIVIIPSDFEILHTSYNADRATVIVREEFLQTGYTAVKSYTYYLHRKNGIWKIYNYEVKNIGTK
ncbi:hypothetical protein [Spirochaeta isovalerica]|uniref:Uncharacterized protein n=1 Tax=Spirochaeta isovalerica TaxID=150 RepID=A0A841R9Q9_9SPIO|nr:hypothetical protein [Spirochaeta isovalerica]MBB6479192.1 hypothetical protein [Spirochaeta isovalerica]